MDIGYAEICNTDCNLFLPGLLDGYKSVFYLTEIYYLREVCSMKKILVTGACGLIGKIICSSLLEKGNVVIGTDEKEDSLNSGKPGYTFIKAGSHHIPTFKKIFKEEHFDTVIHCACTVDNDLENIVTEDNMDYSADYDDFLYFMAKDAGVKQFILLSTSAVYELPKSREPIREDDKLNLESNYAKLKYDAERALSFALKNQKEMIGAALRIAPVYTSDYTDNLINKIFDKETNNLFVYHSGDYGFQFCCLYNLVEFILCFISLAKDYSYTGIYNIADDNIVSAREIIKFARQRKTYGPVIQRKVNVDILKNKINLLRKRNEIKEDYRYNDIDVYFNNNMLDATKAKKIYISKWSIDNTK